MIGRTNRLDDYCQAASIERLFSSAVMRQFCANGASNLFVELLNSCKVLNERHFTYVWEVFDPAFAILSGIENRKEYVYRASLATKILFGKHNISTATMVNEFRVGSSRADVVIFNGTSTAYEIKSERDNLDKLQSQVSAYRHVFPAVYVVSADRHLQSVLAITGGDIGVVSVGKRGNIKTHRVAVHDTSRLSALAILETVRIAEAVEILSLLKVHCPVVPNTLMRKELQNVFSQISGEKVHAAGVSVVKRSRKMLIGPDHLQMVPLSLRASVLSHASCKSHYNALIQALCTPIEVALNWS